MKKLSVKPSAAGVWSYCTGAPGLIAQVPRSEMQQAALDGLVSHAVAESQIHFLTAGRAGALKIGDTTEHGVVSDEIFEGAMEYVNDFMSVFTPAVASDPQTKGGIEDKFHLTRINPESRGIIDSWLYVPSENHVIIWEYKYGRTFVSAEENRQMICCLTGPEQRFKLDPKTTTFEFRVVQPRCFSSEGTIRVWKPGTIHDVYPIITDLAHAAAKALSDRAELSTGEHCRYCAARGYCEAALKTGVDLYETLMAPEILNASPENLSGLMGIFERAESQIKGLRSGFEERIKSEIKNGKVIPGYGMELSIGNLAWKKPADEIIKLGSLLGFDLAKPGVKTPTQAKSAGMNEAVIELNTERPKKGYKLVKDTGFVARIFKGEIA